MSPLYHECHPVVLDQIAADGLKAGEYDILDDLPTENDCYVAPDDCTDLRGYAVTLINTLIETHRPDHFPSQFPAIWFFNTWNGTTEMVRRGLVTVDASEIQATYQLIAMDLSIADALYVNTMDEFELRSEIETARLETLVEEYWDSAVALEDPTAQPHEHTEIYVPTNELPPEHVVELKTSNDGHDYTPYDPSPTETSP